MMYRNRKVEKSVLDFYNALPKNIRQFPLNIKKAMLTLGNCTIHSYQEVAERYNINIYEVIAYCGSDAGCTHKDGNTYIVMFNDSPDMVEERKTFTLAHELGHILLGHLNTLENFGILPRSSFQNQHFESAADYFAVNVLCPMPILSRLKPATPVSVLKLFGLSYQAAEIALKNHAGYGDRVYNIQWHDDILALFDSQCEELSISTYQIDWAERTKGTRSIVVTLPKREYIPPRVLPPREEVMRVRERVARAKADSFCGLYLISKE